jgi:hypothetical protein
LSRQYEILNISQSYRPPRLLTGVALPSKQYFWDDQMVWGERKRSTPGSITKACRFWQEPLKGRDHLKDIDRETTLKWILQRNLSWTVLAHDEENLNEHFLSKKAVNSWGRRSWATVVLSKRTYSMELGSWCVDTYA